MFHSYDICYKIKYPLKVWLDDYVDSDVAMLVSENVADSIPAEDARSILGDTASIIGLDDTISMET